MRSALRPVGSVAVASPRTLIVACAALTRELRVVLAQIGGGDSIVVDYLPSPLHNRPERIPAAVAEAVARAFGAGPTRAETGVTPPPAPAPIGRVVLAYADCGTGGLLDAEVHRLRDTYGVDVVRLPGSHCYEFFAGTEVFLAHHEAVPGTFYLTDYLARHFDALVWSGLGLDRHPTLRDTYFGNYVRVLLLSQSHDPAVVDAGRAAAAKLGLAFEHEPVGMAPFATSLTQLLEST
jgi:Protein of unknown function (DUF1638)